MTLNTPAQVREQTICDWFGALSKDYIQSLIELHDDKKITALKAWHYVFGEFSSANCQCSACLLSQPARKTRLRSSPAQESQCESVAAPVAAVQGEDTQPTLLDFQKFIADRCALADQDLLNLAPCLGDGTVFPTDIQVQLDYMRRLADCQAFIGLFLEFRAINFGGQESAHTPSVVPAGNTGTTVLQGGALA